MQPIESRPAAPPPQELPDPLTRFRAELQEFISTAPEIHALKQEQSALNEQAQANFQADSQLISDRYSQLKELAKQRRIARIQTDETHQRYNLREHETPKARVHRLFYGVGLHLVAEKIYPLDTSEEKLKKLSQARSKTQREIDALYQKAQEERARIEERHQQIQTAIQGTVEDWVLTDRDRVVMYTLEKPQRRQSIFARYSQNSEDPEATFSDLEHNYATLIGTPINHQSERQIPVINTSKPPTTLETTRKRRQTTIGHSKPSRNGSEADRTATDQNDKEKPRYGIGTLQLHVEGDQKRMSVAELTEEEKVDLIKSRSEKIAHGDEILLTDCFSMLESLQTTPIDIATETINARRITIDQTPHPLWKLEPGRRIGLTLNHSLSNHLRVVYAIYKKDGKNIIVLYKKGIYTHREFEKEFPGSRRVT